MKISERSLFIRWAYLPELTGSGRIPHHTDVCRIFWRAFFGVPLTLLVMIPLLVIAAPFFAIAWLSGTKAGAFLVKPMRLPDSGGISVIRQRVIDWKQKTCTRVEIVE